MKRVAPIFVFLFVLLLCIGATIFPPSANFIGTTIWGSSGLTNMLRVGTTGVIISNQTLGSTLLNGASIILPSGGLFIGNAGSLTNFVGTILADNPAAGDLGETFSTNRAASSSQAMATAAATNVCALPVGAGDWDVEGNINYSGTGATNLVGYIGTTSAALVADASEVYNMGAGFPTIGSVTNSVVLPRKRINVNANTTIFLVGKATFGGGTVSTFGTVTARRVR